MTSSKYKLDNLCLIVDNNNLQIDGTVEEVKNSVYPLKDKFKAFGFEVFEIDGHNIDEGKGISYMENNVAWHGKAPSEEEFKVAINELKEMRD